MCKGTKLMPLVMLVDDADVERAAVRRLLEREGYDVVEAADGLDALAVLEGSRPALILLDLSMPDLDGLALLQFLR
jgi:CheY-like chemotaxis protein